MKLHVFSGIAALVLCLNAWGQAEVRLAVHKTFKLPKETIARFEKANDAKVSVITAGSGNEMLNKLILSKANPIADAVYGLDNANIGKARQAGILAERQPESAPVLASMPVALAVDYAYVALNYDKEWFEKHKLPLPKTAAWHSKWRRDTRNVITSSKANSRDYNAFKQPAICVLLDLTNLRATPNALHARHWPKSARESRHHRQTAPPRANAGAARHCPNWPN